jgi:predicted O-methyltransferase YrrM
MFRSRRSQPRKQPISHNFYRRFLHKYFAHDLNFELQVMARREAAAYVREHMAAAMMYADRWGLLQAAVEDAPPEGLFLEFGVEKGGSANFIAENLKAKPGATLHAFDSFEGLPEPWNGTFETRGKFGVGGAIPKLLPNVTIHKGWFAETLPGFCQRNQNAGISLLHVDCDLYSSTATVLAHAGDLLRPGSIVVFDEYFNYHGWQNHEFKAWQEFTAARQVKYAYKGFCARGGHVFLRVEEIGRSDSHRQRHDDSAVAHGNAQ